MIYWFYEMAGSKWSLCGVVTMDFVLEGLLELILDGGVEVGTNRKYSKWIRYPLLILAGVVFFGLIALFVFIGFDVLEDGLWRAIFMWVLALACASGGIWNFLFMYKRHKKKKSKLK